MHHLIIFHHGSIRNFYHEKIPGVRTTPLQRSLLVRQRSWALKVGQVIQAVAAEPPGGKGNFSDGVTLLGQLTGYFQCWYVKPCSPISQKEQLQKTLQPWNPKTLQPSNPQTLKPSKLQPAKSSNPGKIQRLESWNL